MCASFNLTIITILNSHVSFGSLVEFDVVRKFICFGVDGVTVF
jgi:hypothetical protein